MDQEQLNNRLIEFVKNGNLSGVEDALLKGANVNANNQAGWAALHYASYEGHTDIVEVLLNHGANINVVTKREKELLREELKRVEKLEVALARVTLEELLEELDEEELEGSTPVILAAKNGHKDIVLILAQNGANLDIVNKDHMTALHCVTRNNDTEIVRLLLQYSADPNICDKDGNTALHIACKEGHTNIIQSLLSQGADATIKDNEGNTPLDECQGIRKDEIVSLVSEYNPKRVLEDVSEWNIEYVNEEQVFEKPEYGVKFVIPPSSVEKGQEVKTEVKVVAPEESEIILPPDVELVSCFYKIETMGKFSRPIELHLQHNIELRSQEESQQLAFVKAKGPPPYKFELLPTESDQMFRPYDNSGVLQISDFSFVGIVIKEIKSALFQQPSRSYVMTVFFKEMEKFCWEIQAVVTKNLGPFLERVNTEKRFENWKRIDPVTIVDPDINEVTIANECYDIKPMMNPFQVSRKLIDQCQPDTALPYLKFKVSLIDKKELADLELTFNGISEQMSLVIPSYDLQQQQETTTHFTGSTSTTVPTPNMSTSTSNPPVNNEVLCKEPKKKHLTRVLHDIKYMWNTIGEQLEVRYGDIKSAEYNVAYDHTTKLSEVLQVWIDKRTCEVSWRMIIAVVKEPPVENKAVAEKIYKFLVRPDIRNEYISSDQPGQVITTFNSPPSAQPKPIEIKDIPVNATISPSNDPAKTIGDPCISDDDKKPEITSNKEETTTVTSEKHSVHVKGKDDDENPEVSLDQKETMSVTPKDNSVKEKKEKNNSWSLLMLVGIFLAILAYFIYQKIN